MTLRRTALALLAVCTLAAAACGGDAGSSDGTTSTTSPGALSGEIRVVAAASLTEAFGELAERFMDEHEGVTVTTEFGPSSGLADGILEGQPADVFASADEVDVRELVDGGAVDAGAPVVFARNRPEIAVPAGNPGGVQSLDDLARDDLLVGLCAEDVPCGRFARAVLRNASVVPAVDTDEADVKSLLGKLVSDDLDVGLVYHSDVVAAGDDVEGIEIPEDDNVIAVYPITALADAGNADLAQAFVDYVASDAAGTVLERHGFLPPT